MSWQGGVALMQGALVVATWVSLPLLLALTAAGLMAGLLQSALGQSDPTTLFAPRLLAAVLALAFFGLWMLAYTTDYWRALWLGAAQLVR